MRLVIFICVFLFQLVPHDQDANSDSCEIYIISLSRQIEGKNVPVVVKFEYTMSESLLSGLKSTKLIDSKILNQLKRNPNPMLNPQTCDNVRSKLIEWKVYNNANTLDDYVLINMAEPIYTNKSEAYLFFDYLNIKTGRGVAGGASILQIFCEEDNQWQIKSTKILEMY